jgi:hypothetical protein
VGGEGHVEETLGVEGEGEVHGADGGWGDDCARAASALPVTWTAAVTTGPPVCADTDGVARAPTAAARTNHADAFSFPLIPPPAPRMTSAYGPARHLARRQTVAHGER